MFYEDSLPGHVHDFNFEEIRKLVATSGMAITHKTGDGVYFKGSKIVPEWLLPTGLQESIIILAEKSTR